MVSIDTFRQVALSFPETSEQPHFEKISFRTGRKIFATFDIKNNRATVKLSENDQYAFSAFDSSIIFPVPNKWGKQGWTFIDLKRVSKKMFIDILTAAYKRVSPEKLHQ